MLSIGRGPKAVQGKGGALLPCSHLGPRPMLSMQELSLVMPEPMLSLSMLILATYLVAALDVTRFETKIKMTSPNFRIVALGGLV